MLSAKRICSSSPQTCRAHPGFGGSSRCPSPGAGSAGSWSQGCSSESGLKLTGKIKKVYKIPDSRKGKKQCQYK